MTDHLEALLTELSREGDGEEETELSLPAGEPFPAGRIGVSVRRADGGKTESAWYAFEPDDSAQDGRAVIPEAVWAGMPRPVLPESGERHGRSPAEDGKTAPEEEPGERPSHTWETDGAEAPSGESRGVPDAVLAAAGIEFLPEERGQTAVASPWRQTGRAVEGTGAPAVPSPMGQRQPGREGQPTVTVPGGDTAFAVLYRSVMQGGGLPPAPAAAPPTVVVQEDHAGSGGFFTPEQFDRMVRRDSRRYDGGMTIY